MIRFSCECGKALQSRAENAGQQVSCPSCGRMQFVPAVNPDAIRVSEDSVRPAAAADFEEAEPERDAERPSRADAVTTSTSGKAVASLVLGILSLLCNVLAGLPALILGLVALGEINRSRGRVGGWGLALGGVITACAGTLLSCVVGGLLLMPALLLPAVQKTREAAARVQSQNNLKQLAIAMHNYHDVHGHLPAAAICDKNGRPLLSWRVALLPYLEQQNLYAQFKLDEPWNGPHNLKLLGQMPRVYQLPSEQKPGTDQTHYQVFVGNGAIFETNRGLGLMDIPDGTSNTILIVEANQAVPWTKPEDLPYNPNGPLPPLGAAFAWGFNTAFADGSVHFIPKDTPEQTLRPLITRNDGMEAPFP